MQKVKLMSGLVLVMAISFSNSYASNHRQAKQGRKTVRTHTSVPTADTFVSSPLRTSIKLELNAPVSDVWALVGNPGRMPEYSAGLRQVDMHYNASNKCTGYTCHFLPIEKDEQEIEHTEIMKWYEPNQGLASVAEEPNAFGLQQSLGLITFEAKGDKTILKWEMYFDAANEETIKMNVSAFEQALNTNIAQNLIKRFGGRVLDSYIEGKQ